jgi:hypothetical protein
MQKFTSEPIILKTAGMMTRNELRGFLKIGINEVPKIIARFDLPVIEGRIPERAIWNLILKLDPQDETAANALRVPLKDINWLSRTTGKSVSNIRSKIKNKTFEYSLGIQLGVERADQPSPRLRRWPQATILPLIGACAPLNITPIITADCSSQHSNRKHIASANQADTDATDNVFDDIFAFCAQSSQPRSS